MTKQRRRPKPQERWEVWDKYIGEDNAKGPCTVCERPIRFRDMVVGHDVALTKRGQDTIANLRPLCRRCDEAMGTDSIDEYRQRLHGPATASQAGPATAPAIGLEQWLAMLGITTPKPPLRARRYIEHINEGTCYIEGTSPDLDVPFHQGNSRWCIRCHHPHCEKHSHTDEGQRFCVVCWEFTRPYRAETPFVDEQLPDGRTSRTYFPITASPALIEPTSQSLRLQLGTREW